MLLPVNTMEMLMRILGAAVVALLLPTMAFSANTLEPLTPFRTDAPPVIDGYLDDELWTKAPYVTGFKTWQPDFGKDMVEDTKAYYAYDRENLYFGFRCYDSQPDKIKTSITKRDSVHADDWIAINLDSFNDQQSLYAFYINPMGIQADSRYAAGTEDLGFDAVWYSAGVVDDEGYTVEVRIPFKSIRYNNSDPVEMGVIFERSITRLTEMGTYPPLDPAKGATAQNFQTGMNPVFMEGIAPYRLFELLPAVTHHQRSELEEEELVRGDDQNDVSLTVKYGITSDLILDGTVNPDFSQVESDAGQIDINLRSPLFFPEKRPFFLEGRENFNFAGPSHYDPLRAIVHTRNIVDPLTGIKVSGKIGKKNTISTMYARDESPVGLDSGSDADFGIFRYKRTLYEDSYIGGFYTGRERPDGYNRVVGADGVFRLNRSSTLGYHGFVSQTVEDELSPREDGHAVGAIYDYSTRNLTLEFAALDISEEFRTETGYLSREGVSKARVYVGPKFYPSDSVIQRIDIGGVTGHTYDKFSSIWESYNFLEGRLVLPRRSNVSFTFNYSTEVFLGEEFDTTGIRMSGNSQITKKLYFSASFGQGGAVFYSLDPYQGDSQNVSATLRYQATSKIEARVDYTFANFTRELDNEPIYDYAITRGKLTYQVNKYLFFRGIVEYNSFRDELTTDFLAAFLYIPGTVVYFGYGSLYERIAWRDGRYLPADRFLESQRGIFFKASYLWRL
jgi:hypothetical protein